MCELVIANKNYSSWSLRPWLLMKQLEVPFRQQIVAFPDGGAWDTYRKLSPSGRLPCLRNGDTVVWDSLAITEYLGERHPGVWPADPAARAWARCAAAEMHAGFAAVRNACSMSCGQRVRLHQVAPAVARDVARLGELWGDGSAGSVVRSSPARRSPRSMRSSRRSRSAPRPIACRSTRSPPPTWRGCSHSHEAEIAAAGTVLEDLRENNSLFLTVC